MTLWVIHASYFCNVASTGVKSKQIVFQKFRNIQRVFAFALMLFILNKKYHLSKLVIMMLKYVKNLALN